MRTHLWREIALVSAPLFLVGGIFGWGQWQKRFRTPRLTLSVRFEQTPSGKADGFPPDGKLRFGWTANLRGGPQAGYRFGWNEHLVAYTPRGPITIWRPQFPKSWTPHDNFGANISSSTENQFNTSNGLNRQDRFQTYAVSEQQLPIDTQKLVWQGDMAALPSENPALWHSPVRGEQLALWANNPGYVQQQRNIPLKYNLKAWGPVQMSVWQDDRKRTDSPVTVEILRRKGNWRTFRRLIAFNGEKQRLLWTDGDLLSGFCSFGITNTYPTRDAEQLCVDLLNTPKSYGEVALLCDTVFDLSGRASLVATDFTRLNESELAAFQKQHNGFRVKSRLVLRTRR